MTNVKQMSIWQIYIFGSCQNLNIYYHLKTFSIFSTFHLKIDNLTAVTLTDINNHLRFVFYLLHLPWVILSHYGSCDIDRCQFDSCHIDSYHLVGKCQSDNCHTENESGLQKFSWSVAPFTKIFCQPSHWQLTESNWQQYQDRQNHRQ